MKKGDKKGSHAGFAIAFILFVGFVIFLFSILDPIGKSENDKVFLLQHLEDKIIENVSGELMITSVKLKKEGGCIEIEEIFDIKDFKTTENENLLKIYSSEEFEGNNYECAKPSKKYKIGLIRTDEYVFESKVRKLNESYFDNYEGVKNNFGIPDVTDFTFSFSDIDKNEIVGVEKEIPSTDVFAKIIPVTYFNGSEINIGYMRIVLW